MNKISGWFSVFLALPCAAALGANTDQAGDFSDYFQRGRYELTLSSGALFSPVGADQHRHTLNYVLNGLQLGWMVTDVDRAGWLRGNVEVAGEAIGAAVYQGRGSYLAGATLWARYNFVQPNWRVVPYLGAGAGAEATDMDPRLIGETFNFNLDIAIGARCFLAQKWALDLECRYQHISNATIGRHDIGINAVGPMLGVSYFF